MRHLAIAVVGAGELATDELQGGRQHPIAEGRSVAERLQLLEHGDAQPEKANALADLPPALRTAAGLTGNSREPTAVRGVPGLP